LSWNGRTILPNDESVTALLARANNPTGNQADRARAVFTLLARHVRPGSSATDVHRVLTDTAWLQQTHLHGFRALAGWIPVEMGSDHTVFRMYLFPADADKQWSPWVIYFRMSGMLRDEDALVFLRGERAIESTRLVEFALCFPHSSKPGNLVGRIERFSREGIHIYDEWRDPAANHAAANPAIASRLQSLRIRPASP